MITPKKGLRFYHARLLDVEAGGKTPQLCEVTRIARGCVYIRAVYTREDGTQYLAGSATFCEIEDFPRWCLTVEGIETEEEALTREATELPPED